MAKSINSPFHFTSSHSSLTTIQHYYSNIDFNFSNFNTILFSEFDNFN